jgi:hypothetical protein
MAESVCSVAIMRLITAFTTRTICFASLSDSMSALRWARYHDTRSLVRTPARVTECKQKQ